MRGEGISVDLLQTGLSSLMHNGTDVMSSALLYSEYKAPLPWPLKVEGSISRCTLVWPQYFWLSDARRCSIQENEDI